MPFWIRLSRGTRLPVNHPDFAAITPSGGRVIITKDNDSVEILDVFMIEAIEVPAAISRD